MSKTNFPCLIFFLPATLCQYGLLPGYLMELAKSKDLKATTNLVVINDSSAPSSAHRS